MKYKRIIRFWKKYSNVIILILPLVLFSGILSFTLDFFIDLYPDQVYSLVSFHLNGNTEGSVTAALKVYDPINDTFVENTIIKQIIEQDILWLEEENVELDLVISKYQDSDLPGGIDILLENTFYNDRGEFRILKEAIYKNEERFWYVEKIEQTTLPEDSYGYINAYSTGCAFGSKGDYRAYIGFKTFQLADESWSTTFADNGTLVPSWYIFNGTHWIFNEAFNETLFQEIQPLESKIEGIESISIGSAYISEDEVNIQYDLMYPNSTISSYIANDFGNVDITIRITARSEKAFRVKLKIFETHLVNYWFVQGFYDMGCEDFSGFGLIFIGIPVSVVCSAFITLFAILLLKEIIRKLKIRRNK